MIVIIRHRKRANSKPETVPMRDQAEKKTSILFMPARVISSLRAWSSPFIMVRFRD